jgi:hypothetical protein
VALGVTGCAGDGIGSDEAVAKALLAPTFEDFNGIFPTSDGEAKCSVRVGVGVEFEGTCSTQALRGRNGSYIVTFTQDFGSELGKSGRHVWIVRVPRDGGAHVVRELGGAPIQTIP